MPKTITSTELQKNARNVIDWTRTKNDAVIVETYGKPMAALLSYDEYQAYMHYKQQQAAARSTRFERLQQAAADNAAFNGLGEAEAAALVEEARSDLHQQSTTL